MNWFMFQEGVVEDYSISQCSLEDVFINFARKAEEIADNSEDKLRAQLSPESSRTGSFSFVVGEHEHGN